MVLMRVSEPAERSGVAATTLRYYGERGLLPAQRSPAWEAARLLGALGPGSAEEG
ncbi:MerR family DNA-binding transcriptional regulator [Nocardiopsis sp. NPDC057823]|uniref:MerR family DNA-binding transcriptional regulator n=1 Tax=Nocardiopsis sp. NPDC057823 TaxID=3346256 RepID=UPI003670CF89